MMRRDPAEMSDDEVAEKWADYIDMHEDVSGRLDLPARDIEPIPPEEMVERNMVFVGNIPVVEPLDD